VIEIVATSPGTPHHAFGPVLRTSIVRHMSAFEPLHPGDGVVPLDELRPAAVCLTVVDTGDGTAALVLTRRASTLRAHSGQWALPGGRLDADETPVDAARRELHEEVGLEATPADVLGTLDVYPTRSGYAITPVVVWGGPIERLHPNPDEVASIHLLPLGELDRSDSPEMLEIPESPRPVIKLLIGDSNVHAPTAAVIHQFHQVCLLGRTTTRVHHLEQPTWAWR
jgi:8-oxo-dGTP pyrophosphatase MutT (NUDIX family)